ncbi:MAG: DUF5658 family protein [Nitrosomonas sp.]|nr:DUF5658 family protein [Nitrosomonas sp.]
MTCNKAVIDKDKRNYERRSGMPFFCKFQLGIKSGRRSGGRRDQIKAPAYVDIYSNHLVFCVISIMILSSLDAFFTLNILAEGGEELNVFMEVLIADSLHKFVAVKLALTAFALLLLTIHHEVKLTQSIRVVHLIYFILSGYAVLIGYEITLLSLTDGHL